MDRPERRKYKRLPITLALSSVKVGLAGGKSHKGYTVNISPNGLYFEAPDGKFKRGNLLKIELSILPTAGVLEFGGRLWCFASVLRADNIRNSHTSNDLCLAECGVAVEFCRPPKLCI